MMLTFAASLPMLVCAFWAAVLWLDVLRRPDAARGRLVQFFVVALVLYISHFVFYFHVPPSTLHASRTLAIADTIYCVCNLAIYPLYLVYLYRLTRGRAVVRCSLLGLLPAVALGAAVGVVYGLMPTEETARFVDTYLYRGETGGFGGWAAVQLGLHKACKVVFGLLLVYVLVVGWRLIRRFDVQVQALYADTEGRTLHALRTCLLLLTVNSVVGLLTVAVGRWRFFDHDWDIALWLALLAVLLFAVGYTGQIQQFGIDDMPADAEPEPSSDLPKPTVTVVARQLDELMDGEQLFLQPDLKLSDLAVRLGTNRRYLSAALNEVFGQSFAEYVNRRRVAYAEQLMERQPDLSATDVAHMSGYTIMSSFYRNMKAYGKS